METWRCQMGMVVLFSTEKPLRSQPLHVALPVCFDVGRVRLGLHHRMLLMPFNKGILTQGLQFSISLYVEKKASTLLF